MQNDKAVQWLSNRHYSASELGSRLFMSEHIFATWCFLDFLARRFKRTPSLIKYSKYWLQRAASMSPRACALTIAAITLCFLVGFHRPNYSRCNSSSISALSAVCWTVYIGLGAVLGVCFAWALVPLRTVTTGSTCAEVLLYTGVWALITSMRSRERRSQAASSCRIASFFHSRLLGP